MFTVAIAVLAIHAVVALAFGVLGAIRFGKKPLFALTPADIRRGLFERDAEALVKIQTFAGFLLFVVFAAGAVGVGMLSAGNTSGWVFLCAGAGLLVVFAFLILSARAPEE